MWRCSRRWRRRCVSFRNPFPRTPDPRGPSLSFALAQAGHGCLFRKQVEKRARGMELPHVAQLLWAFAALDHVPAAAVCAALQVGNADTGLKAMASAPPA
jgi:hypothetical protein